MNTGKIFILLGVFFSTSFFVLGQASLSISSSPQTPQPTPYAVTKRSANANIWERTVYERAPDGSLISKKHQYTELASGLNFKDVKTGQWMPSKEEIDILPDGTAAATNGQHQVYFPSDIYNGEIRMVTPDGKVLRSRPLGLFYDDGNNTVMIAALTNSVGELVDNNQVIYPNAFVGLNADLRYTYTKAGFEQDIVLREQPLTPESYGLNADTAKLQVLTEFFNPPQPTVSRSTTLSSQAGLALADRSLGFGTMQMIRGRAFLMGQNAKEAGAMVAKQWLQLDGRQFLIEAVPVNAIVDKLAALPLTTMNSVKAAKMASNHPVLPPQRLAKNDTSNTMMMAKAEPLNHGFVLDYQTINSSLTNYTFQGDTTYYISGTAVLYGTNTFEGGAVIKYTSNASITLESGSILNCQGAAYRPTIFTAKDDNSVGETISGSTGNPSGYYATTALLLAGGVSGSLANIRIAYAHKAIYLAYQGFNISDAQFIDCQAGVGIASGSANLENALFSGVQTNFFVLGGSIIAQNVTFNASLYLAASPVAYMPGLFPSTTLSFTNCIVNMLFVFTNTGGISLNGNYNGFYNGPRFGGNQLISSRPPFLVVGAGSYYLTNDCAFRNAGTTNIDPALLAELATKTTYPPIVYSNTTISVTTTFSPQAQRDTDTPDLGYHYDPLDYAFCNVRIPGIVAVNFTAGTAAAWFSHYVSGGPGWGRGDTCGLSLTNNASLVTFSGTANSPCVFTSYDTVQEGGTANWMWCYVGGIINQQGPYSENNPPIINSSFTHFSHLPNEANSYRDGISGQPIIIAAKNCEFYGSSGGYNILGGYTNCLFYRDVMGIQSGVAYACQIFLNSTFYGGSINFTHWEGPANSDGPPYWYSYIHNCSFDNTTFNIDDPFGVNTNYADYDYNAFLTNAPQPPTEGANTVLVTNFNWQSSWLGDFYLPSDSLLIDAGSTTADQLGLYHFTTQTNQTKETNSVMDIGYHYVATDQYGDPLDTFDSGTPDYLLSVNDDVGAWLMNYFGDLNHSGSDLDADGNTLASDYQDGVIPTIFVFSSIDVANNYVNSGSAPAQLNVSGLPYYIAISVDDTNYAMDAVWNNYTSSNITINLGSTEGWHDVWIGLRGHADDPTNNVWLMKRLKLDFTPPLLVVTNPVVAAGVATMSVPLVQIQGYSPEELDSIHYDLSNAMVVLTNQDAGITDQSFDTSSWEFTTNYFECVDVPLTNGVNIITLHATDEAGNMTTTNISITLDYSSRTNPPVVRLYWPQDGTAICNDTYTWRGWVDDPMASVIASMVDTNGNTNTFNAIVERDGNFWIEDMPMIGTNVLSLMVKDSAGNVATTNITVYPGAVALTINPVSSDDLWNQTLMVSGTIGDPDNYTVWVNGVKATNNEDGTWEADDVPNTDGGTSVIQARVIPNTDNGGNGTGGSGTSASYDNLGNPDSAQAQDLDSQGNKPARVYMKSYNLSQDEHSDATSTTYGSEMSVISILKQSWEIGASFVWNNQSGGNGLNFVKTENSGTGEDHIVIDEEDPSEFPAYGYGTITFSDTVTDYDNPDNDDSGSETEPFEPDFPSEYCALNGQLTASTSWFIPSSGHETDQKLTYNRNAQTTYELHTGGKSGSSRQNLFVLSASALSGTLSLEPEWILEYPYISADTPVDSTQIQIMGKNEDADGNVYVLLADNTTQVVTPQVKGKDYYTFTGPTHGKYTPTITANGVPLDPDNVVDGADFCVGQGINFDVTGIPGRYDLLAIWTLPGTFVNTNSDPNCNLFYEENAAYLKPLQGTSTIPPCWYVKDGQSLMASVHVYYRCTPNGTLFDQIVTGKFNVHRPTTTKATPYQPDGTPTAQILGGSLSLGDNARHNDMSFQHQITTDGFTSGQAGYVQLVSGEYTLSSTGLPIPVAPNGGAGTPDTELDTGEFPRGQPSISANANSMVNFWDGPADGLYQGNAKEDLDFSTYLMFKPSGGIWVPLRLITWELHDEAANGAIVNGNAPITGDSDCTTFPDWKNTWTP